MAAPEYSRRPLASSGARWSGGAFWDKMKATVRPSVSIVVPTYNERGRLAEVVDAALRVFERAGIAGEIVVVDDNSPDGTGALADDLATRLPVRVVHRPGKLGLGTAVIDGFAVAAAPFVGVMDGDLSHPPELVPVMLAALKETGADFAIGSRYVRGGGTRNWSAWRVGLSRAACVLARAITPVRDATSGFFLIARDAVGGVAIAHGGFKICLELLVHSRARRVVEVPYVFAGRDVGESKMNLREAAGYFRQVWDLRRDARRRPGPPLEHVILAPERAAALGAPPLRD
jgi:dolichol-phosphate mannosyltransferase